jgi:DNA-binding winged helix-turn-helix (wHTH) protein
MNALSLVDPEASRSEPLMQSRWSGVAPSCVRFGSVTVYPRARELRVQGKLVETNNCAFEILLMLIQADGQLVTKKALFQRLWPNTCVADSNLRVQMYKLRKVLGENAQAIRTAPNRGYRLTAPLTLPSAGTLEEVTGSRPERPAAVFIIVDRDEDIRAALDELLRSHPTQTAIHIHSLAFTRSHR